jgi:hypothetical protein
VVHASKGTTKRRKRQWGVPKNRKHHSGHQGNTYTINGEFILAVVGNSNFYRFLLFSPVFLKRNRFSIVL